MTQGLMVVWLVHQQGVAGAGGELVAEQMVVSGGRREDGTVERDLWTLDTGNASEQPRNIGKRGIWMDTRYR